MFYSNTMCFFIADKLPRKNGFMEEKTLFNSYKLLPVR